jgi:hypothetical protein
MKALAIRLEQFYGLFLKPSYRCAQNLRTIFKTTKGLVALVAQKTANAFRASLSSSVWTTIMIVIYTPTFPGAGVCSFADSTNLRLLVIPIGRKTSPLTKHFYSSHFYFFWFFPIEALCACYLFLSLFFKPKRKTFFTNVPTIRLAMSHKRLLAVVADSFNRCKAVWITLPRRAFMSINQASLHSGITSVISPPDALREAISAAWKRPIFTDFGHGCNFASWAQASLFHNSIVIGDEGVVNV